MSELELRLYFASTTQDYYLKGRIVYRGFNDSICRGSSNNKRIGLQTDLMVKAYTIRRLLLSLSDLLAHNLYTE